MDEQTQLKVQAWLDGELDPAERKAIERLTSADPEARALVQELRAAKSAMGGFAEQVRVPISRELYWSAIESGIRQDERRKASTDSSVGGWLDVLRRYLVPAGTLAALVIAGLLAGMQSGAIDEGNAAQVESALASAGSLTYRDFASGTTLVWVSYPAEKEFAEYGGGSTLP